MFIKFKEIECCGFDSNLKAQVCVCGFLLGFFFPFFFPLEPWIKYLFRLKSNTEFVYCTLNRLIMFLLTFW